MGFEGTPTVTRRTLLGGAAAAGAASLIAPAAGLARATSRASISTRWVGLLSGESPPIAAPRQFALVGIEWAGPPTPRIQLRTHAPDGRWSRWVEASVVGHDGDGRTARPPSFGEPVWTGPAGLVQLRSDGVVRGVRLHFVSANLPAGATLATAPPLALPILDAGPGQPPIIARSAWAGTIARPTNPPNYGTIKLAFVHHTETPNGYRAGHVPAILRSIFDYHVYVRGFFDIAYNFMIDAYGRIWEARAGGIDMAVIGAQAGAYNAESTGVAVIGSFMNHIPPPAAIAALEQLLAWKMSLHGLPTYGQVTVVVDPADAFYTPFPPGAHVSLPRVAGHRDGDSTDCPGDAFYNDLPSIRPQITTLAGTPAVLTTTAAPSTTVAPGTVVTVSGQLQLLSGTPLAGEPIELQQLGPQGPPAVTIATTSTGSDGTWTISLSAAQKMLLRALHRPTPAAVADWTLVAVAPTITLALQSASPLVVTGTISAPKRWVTVAAYRVGHPHRAVARRQVRVSGGGFAARLPIRRAGTYVVLAESAADPNYVPGSSPPLTVTVP